MAATRRFHATPWRHARMHARNMRARAHVVSTRCGRRVGPGGAACGATLPRARAACMCMPCGRPRPDPPRPRRTRPVCASRLRRRARCPGSSNNCAGGLSFAQRSRCCDTIDDWLRSGTCVHVWMGCVQATCQHIAHACHACDAKASLGSVRTSVN